MTLHEALCSGWRGEFRGQYQCPCLQFSTKTLYLRYTALVALARSPRSNRFSAFPGDRAEKAIHLLSISIQWNATSNAWNLLHCPLHEVSPTCNKLILVSRIHQPAIQYPIVHEASLQENRTGRLWFMDRVACDKIFCIVLKVSSSPIPWYVSMENDIPGRNYQASFTKSTEEPNILNRRSR